MVTETRTEEYLRLNSKYLPEAQQFLGKEDLAQASEKLWGAAAEIVKAVAAKRGVELGTHASLWAYVDELDWQNPDLGLIEKFSYAGNLHTNFYENWLSKGYVVRGMDIVKDFVENMKRLLSEPHNWLRVWLVIAFGSLSSRFGLALIPHEIGCSRPKLTVQACMRPGSDFNIMLSATTQLTVVFSPTLFHAPM